MLFSNGSGNLLTGLKQDKPESNTGTLEKMIVANGNVAMDLDLNRLNGSRARAKVRKSSELRFDVERNSFFTVIVFNDELRGTLPSSMGIIPQNSATLPAKLNASYQQLVIERTEWGEPIRTRRSRRENGFVFFNIEGHEFEYDAGENLLNIQAGRLLMSKEFAVELGRPSEAGTVVGNISISATVRPIEVTEVVDGEVTSDVMPALSPQPGTVPGPDVVVGDVNGLAQFGGSSGTQVGLAVGTDSCNFGTENLNWFAIAEQ